ncbi:MAG TPA: CapA family protein [Kofleriaceae bacterium]|nr:CapA family protein [Kofleriaceae bacterium]
MLVALSSPAAAGRPVQADPDVVVMSFTGDVAWPDGKNDFSEMRARGAGLFEQVRGLLERSDLAFANVECPITARKTVATKTYPFRCQPETLEWILGTGINLLSLANNHARDAGAPGIADTLDLLEHTTSAERPIFWAGVGRTPADARAPAIFTVPGKKLTVALFAVANAGGAGGGLVGGLWDKTLPERIRAARTQADVVIVSSHGGPEYIHTPTADFARRYRELIDAGATLIIGHHPHVVQGVERHGDGFILYSLGNFSFGSITSRHLATGARMYSLIARAKFRGGKLHRIELVPLYANNGSSWTLGERTVVARLGVPQLIAGPFAQYALDELEAFSRAVPEAGPTALVRLGDRFYVDMDGEPVTDTRTAAILLGRQATDWAAVTALAAEPRAATPAEREAKSRAGTPWRAEPPAPTPRGRGKATAERGRRARRGTR